MASSKDYSDEVQVPPHIVALEKLNSNVVFCNLRPGQRSEPLTEDEKRFRKITAHSDGETIAYDVARFLKGIKVPTRVVILYQGYGTEVSTVVANLEPIVCWADTEFPRLDFEKPENWNHCPNLWGSFVLAIAQVSGVATSNVLNDPKAEHFLRIAVLHGIPSQVPRVIALIA